MYSFEKYIILSQICQYQHFLPLKCQFSSKNHARNGETHVKNFTALAARFLILALSCGGHHTRCYKFKTVRYEIQEAIYFILLESPIQSALGPIGTSYQIKHQYSQVPNKQGVLINRGIGIFFRKKLLPDFFETVILIALCLPTNKYMIKVSNSKTRKLSSMC